MARTKTALSRRASAGLTEDSPSQPLRHGAIVSGSVTWCVSHTKSSSSAAPITMPAKDYHSLPVQRVKVRRRHCRSCSVWAGDGSIVGA